jgi:hypothetical protein
MKDAAPFGQLTERRDALAALIDAITGTLQDTDFGDDESLMRPMKIAGMRLQNARFSLGFVGDWNSGKSSLINRLLFDEDVLPVEDRATTARCVVIRYGKEKRLYRLPAQPRGTDDLEILAEGSNEVCGRLKELATGIMGPEDLELLLEWPSEVLESGLVIVDTPGLCDERMEVTEEYASRLDGVVVVNAFDPPPTQHLWDFLENQVFQNHMRKFFFLMNKIDLVDPEGDGTVQERMAYQRHQIAKAIQRLSAKFKSDSHQRDGTNSDAANENRFFAVSAKTGEGLEGFLASLDRFACQERFSRVIRESVYRLETAFHSLRCKIDQEKYAVSQKIDDIRVEEENYRKKRSATEKQIRNTLGVFDGNVEDLIEEGQEKAKAIFDRALDAASQFEDKNDLARYNLLPYKLAKKVREFTEDQSKDISDRIENLESNLRGKLKTAVIKCLEDLRNHVSDLADVAPKDAIPQDIEAQDVRGILGPGVGGGLGGLAVGGSLAWLTGAASVTTATVSSTLPGWVPGATWLAGHGLFATSSTTTAFALTSSALACVLLPGAVLGAGASIGCGMYSKRKILKRFGEYQDSLRQSKKKISQNIQGIRERSREVREQLKARLGSQIDSIDQEIERCKDTAEKSTISEDAQKVAEVLPVWKEQVNEFLASTRPQDGQEA